MAGNVPLKEIAGTWTWQASCVKCGHNISIRTSPRVQTSRGKKWTINLGAVCGEMSISGGFTRLNSTLALMDVTGMQTRMYTDTEDFLRKEMRAHNQCRKSLVENRHTVAMNSFHHVEYPV